MATLTIRNLADETMRALKALADSRGRSVEAEAHDLLQHGVGLNRDAIGAWLNAASRMRGDFDAPQRSLPREPDD